MIIDNFEYIREDDESIIFNIVLLYPLTNMVTDETYYYSKSEKSFKYVDDNIKQLFNEYFIKYYRENKLKRILND